MATALKMIRFFVNGNKVETTESELTGTEIKALGGVPNGETLFLKHGHDDDPIADDQVVQLRNGMKFASAPDGNVS